MPAMKARLCVPRTDSKRKRSVAMIDVEKLSKELEDRFPDVQFEIYDDCVEIDFDFNSLEIVFHSKGYINIKTMYLEPKYLKKVGEIVSVVGESIVERMMSND